MGAKNINESVFTVKDLIIAIVLLGVVAAFVLVVINPVERANQTRDREYKDFAAQVVAAEQRTGSAASFGFENVLKVQALKEAFSGKAFITRGTDLGASIFIGKAAGASSLVYACYIPESKFERNDACRSGKVYTLSSLMGVRNGVVLSACAPPAVWQEGSEETAWMICVPD